MLCDDFVADEGLRPLYDRLDKVIEKIYRAQKFVLAPEFCVAADGLVENIPELHKVVPMCRIPFPLTWIEFLHDDRPHWDPNSGMGARPVDPTRHQGAPQRVGFLLEQLENAKQWEAHLFWKLRNVPMFGQGLDTPLNASLLAMRFDADASLNMPDPLFSATTPQPARFGLGLMTELRLEKPDIFRKLLEYGLEDWGGETRFIVAVLGLLNARNVVRTEKVDKEFENIKRARKGKRPLFTHTLIKVRPFIVTRSEATTGKGHRNLKLSFVRGHFKHRKTGLFWWSMHARGDAKYGVVEHEYEVEGK